MSRALNLLFHGLHLFVILFCLIGWIFEPLRQLHLLLVIAVAFSWFVLGYFFGFGYCLLTDLHWKLKKRTGRQPATDSYVKYMADKLTGFDCNPVLIERVTSLLFFVSLAASLLLNISAM